MARLDLDYALTQAKITYANIYPNILVNFNLSSSFSKIRELLNNPLGSVGINFISPYLNPAKIKAERRNADLTIEDASLSFRETVFNALSEIELALADRVQIESDFNSINQKIEYIETELSELRVRKRNGIELARRVRQSEDILRAYQQNKIELQLIYWDNYTFLVKALASGI